jgi:hypothetical protein
VRQLLLVLAAAGSSSRRQQAPRHHHRVALTNLDGSGFLRGDYATVVSETGNPAYSPTNTFRHTRHQDEFEQVMAYYWITQAQRYIHSLGFGDYWAVTVGDVVESALGVPTRAPLACVADWDAVSYTSTVPHCLGRVDQDLHFPADLSGEVHHDGQIWSRALWDIRQALGNVRADTIILQGSFDFSGTTMPELANRTDAAAQQLYGRTAATVVTKVFTDRGIL